MSEELLDAPHVPLGEHHYGLPTAKAQTKNQRIEAHDGRETGNVIIRRNDSRDISPAELKLLRVGHQLWLDRKKALKSGTVDDYRAIEAALETVWQLKRELRAELKATRAKEAEATREYFRHRKAA